jgi:hypothetical protein
MDAAKTSLLTLLCAALCVIGSSAGTCKFLLTGTAAENQQTTLLNPCARVVDYKYYLPDSLTDAQLAAGVKAALSVDLVQMPTSCQGSIIALTCASAYMECKADIVLTDPATYNFDIYAGVSSAQPVPYIK